MLVSTTSDNLEKASIKANTELEHFCRPLLLYFRNVPFMHSRLFVFRQTGAVERFSPFQRDGPPMVCVTLLLYE